MEEGENERERERKPEDERKKGLFVATTSPESGAIVHRDFEFLRPTTIRLSSSAITRVRVLSVPFLFSNDLHADDACEPTKRKGHATTDEQHHSVFAQKRIEADKKKTDSCQPIQQERHTHLAILTS